MIGGGGDADGAKDARAKLGTRSESVYKDRFRPSLGRVRRIRGGLCGNQIFNPTSMCAHATVLTQALRLCFENST